ncbi:hypothetical protein H5410_026757 [Solanum commersonii]|uniref:Uncharacterized protein n=1 Tax=Solanum commersonii TaxID=4109 RepID=A0A9J5YXE9_SOLCO|nr:hypothetical protein H5410_026757 [Solanum commersonii]
MSKKGKDLAQPPFLSTIVWEVRLTSWIRPFTDFCMARLAGYIAEQGVDSDRVRDPGPIKKA